MDAGGAEVQQRYVIDGQHRQQVLKSYFEEEVLFAVDFQILVFEQVFHSEVQLIESFNNLNKCKPLKPMEDENLILNVYIQALQKVFGKKKFLRSGSCHRPYLSTDKLRETLRSQFATIPKTEAGIQTFAEEVKAYNDRLLADDTFVLGIRSTQKSKFFESGKKIGFVLAYDEKMPWISQVLKILEGGKN
jgi:hypothetical protein